MCIGALYHLFNRAQPLEVGLETIQTHILNCFKSNLKWLSSVKRAVKGTDTHDATKLHEDTPCEREAVGRIQRADFSLRALSTNLSVI
jgi:hypothetical protein